MIERLIQTLPFESQKSILGMVNILQVNARNEHLRVESMKKELVIVRNISDKAQADFMVATRQIENLKVKVSGNHEKFEAVVDLVRDKDEHATRTQLLIERLRRDNTLLKESIEAMDLSAPSGSRGRSPMGVGSGERISRPLSHRLSSASTSSQLSTIRSPTDEQIIADAIRDAELSIADDDSCVDVGDEAWLQSAGTSMTDAGGNHLKSHPRPATAPMMLPAVATPGPGNDDKSRSVQFESSVTESVRQRPKTAGAGAGVGTASPQHSIGMQPKALSAPDLSGKFGKMARSGSPQADYILPQLDSPNKGTFRNLPESHMIEKLRHALLRMSRDKYRSEKREKILNKHIDNLKAEIKELSSKIRHLQIELAEFRGHSERIEFAATFHGKQPVWKKEKPFGPMDELFKTMIERRAFNPVDMILQFRRIVDYLSRLPGTLNVAQIARHIGSKDMMQILEVDMIVIFVIEPNNPHTAKKYTVRCDKPDIIDLGAPGHRSMFAEVVGGKCALKVNRKIKSSSFNPAVDGCPGVAVRNAMTVPLQDESTDRVIGAIQLINKDDGRTAFTELDELFLAVYASMCVSALLSCEKFRHVSFRADTVSAILDAPQQLLSLMPEPTSLFVKDVQVLGVLKALEDVCKDSLHCLRVKAFIVTDCLRNSEDGFLLALDARTAAAHSSSRKSMPLLRTTQVGAAGYAALTKKWHIVAAGEVDLKAHPDVDLETSGVPYFTVPVLNVRGQPLAVLQMAVGYQSPKINLIEGREDSIDFEKAAQWLVQALRAPLQLVLASIGEDLNKSYLEIRKQTQRSFIQALSMSPGADSMISARRPVDDDDFDDDDDDDEAVNGGDQDKLFEELMKEMQDAQARIAEVVKENTELKQTVHQIQALYLNETRARTIAAAEPRPAKPGASGQRRSFDR